MKTTLIIFILIPFLSISQEKTDSIFIRKISDEIMVNGKAYDLLRHLTKNIGGRLAGSPQFNQAIAWGKETMQQLQADTVYLQQCMVPHWVRGGMDKASIKSIGGKKSDRNLDILALGNSLGTGRNGLTAEVVAIQSFDELEKRKDELKGKIVFYNVAFNPTDIVPGRSYGAMGKYRRYGASRAAKYGAAGVLIRSLSGSTDNNPHTGAMEYNDSFPKVPAAALGLQDADYLWNSCKNNQHVVVSYTTNGHFLPDTIGYNVIAELKGADDEYITIGGHLDSWDVNEGAHDDGAGVVQTMQVLQAFKALGYKPKHTIRFVLFANEENGLRGGLKYAEEALQKNEKHLFALESDGGGFTPRQFAFDMDDAQIQRIQPWKDLLIPYGVYLLTPGGGGADLYHLNKKLKTPIAELYPDNQRYFDIHHARSDVFEAVNKRELLLGAINMAALVFLVDKYGL